MKHPALLSIAAFALLVACSESSAPPSAPTYGPDLANTPPKPGAHFQSATAVLVGANLVVSFREVGLGEGNVTETASASATAEYACQNKGGQFPDDPRKQSVSGPVSATGIFPVSKNGHIEGSLTLTPPASTLECPRGQRVVLANVSYTNVSITDVTNQVTMAIPGTFSAEFFDVP